MSGRRHVATRRARHSHYRHVQAELTRKVQRSGLADIAPLASLLPTLELADGRVVVPLEDLANRFSGRLELPVVELADGRLAVVIGGGPLKPTDYGPELVCRAGLP